jgi:hypothetical protein
MIEAIKYDAGERSIGNGSRGWGTEAEVQIS